MDSIDRTYQVRGRQVYLRELADLAAVRSAQADSRSSTAGVLESLAPEVDLPQVRAFEDAGWSFVARDKARDGATVYLRPNGRLALGTNRLTVRVTGTHSAEEAEAFLAQEGVQVIDRLKFASNLFVVEVPSGHHPLEAAANLTSSNEVEFAEPELIEIIPHR